MNQVDGKAIAPEGQVWVCALCGRRAKSRWGFDEQNNSTALDHGYDSSCMSHAVLCFEERGPDGSYRAVGEMHRISLTINVGQNKKPYSAPQLRRITDPDEIERLQALFAEP